MDRGPRVACACRSCVPRGASLPAYRVYRVAYSVAGRVGARNGPVRYCNTMAHCVYTNHMAMNIYTIDVKLGDC